MSSVVGTCHLRESRKPQVHRAWVAQARGIFILLLSSSLPPGCFYCERIWETEQREEGRQEERGRDPQRTKDTGIPSLWRWRLATSQSKARAASPQPLFTPFWKKSVWPRTSHVARCPPCLPQRPGQATPPYNPPPPPPGTWAAGMDCSACAV